MIKINQVSILSVIVAAIAVFIFSALWYSPFMFGNIWMEAKNYTPEQFQESFIVLSVINFIVGCVIAFVVAAFTRTLGCNNFKDSFIWSLWLGIGFVAINMFGGYINEPNFNLFIYFIDATFIYIRTFIFILFATFWYKKV